MNAIIFDNQGNPIGTIKSDSLPNIGDYICIFQNDQDKTGKYYEVENTCFYVNNEKKDENSQIAVFVAARNGKKSHIEVTKNMNR